jgi:broad specificity phosphatase PhoE
MMKYCTIYLVRHGQTEWNVKNLIQGHGDSRLTDKGIEQAKQLGKKFDKIKFGAVFSSDLMRAKRTAEIIILEKKMAVKTSHLLREKGFGKYEGMAVAEYRSQLKDLIDKFENLSEKEKRYFKLAPDIETNDEVVTRLIQFLREVSLAYIGKNILVVSHGAVLRLFLIHLGFATDKTLPAGSIANTAYIKLLSDGTDYFIKETYGVEKKK